MAFVSLGASKAIRQTETESNFAKASERVHAEEKSHPLTYLGDVSTGAWIPRGGEVTEGHHLGHGFPHM